MSTLRQTTRLDDMTAQPPQLCAPHKRISTDISQVFRQLTGTHLFQPKLDGIRCLAVIDGDRVTLRSRKGDDLTRVYPEVVGSLASMKVCTVLDGELVHYGSDGTPEFTAMSWRNAQRNSAMIARSASSTPVSFVAFDTLWLGEWDLRRRPLTDRLDALDGLAIAGAVQRCPSTDDGLALWERVQELQLEGVVAKLASSRYTGRRCLDWIKIKSVYEASVIVGQALASEHRTVGKVEVHVLDGDEPISLGEVGTGWTERQLADLTHRLHRYSQDPENIDPVVIDVGFTGRYPDGKLKGAAFRRLRTDVDWTTCTLDQEGL